MPILQSYARNPADRVAKGRRATAFLSQSVSQILGGACALASADVRKGMGRGSGNLGNIPEAAGCVNSCPAGRFWSLKF